MVQGESVPHQNLLIEHLGLEKDTFDISKLKQRVQKRKDDNPNFDPSLNENYAYFLALFNKVSILTNQLTL
jgi:hypothetical protein